MGLTWSNKDLYSSRVCIEEVQHIASVHLIVVVVVAFLLSLRCWKPIFVRLASSFFISKMNTYWWVYIGNLSGMG